MKTLQNVALRLLSLTLLCGGLGAMTYVAQAADQTPPAVGVMAPDFKLMSQEEKPVSLKDYRGKWIVLYFYPKDFTRGCTIEAHNFQQDLAKYDEKNAVILGVSMDTVESHKQFCDAGGLYFKLLSDVKGEVVSQYGSLRETGTSKVAARNTFIVDPQGKIARVFLGVDPNKHSEEALAALAELAQARMAR
ncbi:MAG: peroxiredoxin [Acidobacteria bacterium]|nr:peroxiredoxin [Acidobacteriota bacterium]